jgi:predicted MPP superfamily phosphohydrolase
MVFFVAGVLFLILEVRVLVGFFVKREDKYFIHYTRRKWARIAAIAAAVLVLAAVIDGFFVEPDRVVAEHLVIKSERIKAKVRIVQISDLHMEGFGTRHERALEIVRDAQPDIILLTGDYLNGSRLEYLPGLERFVSELKAPLGVFAIGGNFEFWQEPYGMFENKGIQVLENGSVHFDNLGLTICGLKCVWDLGGAERDLIERAIAADPDGYMLVACHYPNHIEEPEMACVNLYLCGHTHGGQVRLPLWGAIVTLSKLGKRYECGRYVNGNTDVYVNRGLGMEGGWVPRVRFLCRPEVTVIDICPLSK